MSYPARANVARLNLIFFILDKVLIYAECIHFISDEVYILSIYSPLPNFFSPLPSCEPYLFKRCLVEKMRGNSEAWRGRHAMSCNMTECDTYISTLMLRHPAMSVRVSRTGSIAQRGAPAVWKVEEDQIPGTR